MDSLSGWMLAAEGDRYVLRVDTVNLFAVVDPGIISLFRLSDKILYPPPLKKVCFLMEKHAGLANWRKGSANPETDLELDS